MKNQNGICRKYRPFSGKAYLYAVLLATLLCTVKNPICMSQTADKKTTLIETVNAGYFNQ